MTTRRAQCPTCLRAASACICHWIRPIESRAALLILQHPMETANAKNSARLLHLCLPGSTLAIGETFEDMEDLLAGPRQPVLLYPETPGDRSLGIAPPPPFGGAAPEQVLLVVLDATWRKSRKMLYLNPALQALPRLALRDVPASHYLIRKAHAPGQLSTLEAAAYALARLEGDDSRFAPLLDAFDGFVGQQQALAAAHRPG
ncbi:tRNA-uridine aminocarboxypropyltransferase [Pseudoduganella albidiflava]|uniref:tRNA-uridine aminocarboxypropyltransferase n=1 Tax=Pseudoduganella albidiflava TaxID=321983 RepID=A0A411WUT1_9BURK|nr:tRNA-uridine aminocarboxypropyltransferase [Pseudoduganella albidiflava]QBI00516.1 DTW domain-containing protein [Pseudoduganella albidiflava]GGY32699.1 DTW domain-containing protein [Pseudoduganella albidiflava]